MGQLFRPYFVSDRMQGNSHGHAKSGVRVDILKEPCDLFRTICYLTKMPLLGNRLIKKGDQITQRPCEVSMINHYHLFEAMRNYRVMDLWFSGGEGSDILRAVMVQLRSLN